MIPTFKEITEEDIDKSYLMFAIQKHETDLDVCVPQRISELEDKA